MPCANDPGKNNYPCRNGYYLRCVGSSVRWHGYCFVTRVRNPELGVEMKSNKLAFWFLNTGGSWQEAAGFDAVQTVDGTFEHECQKDIDCARVLASKNLLTPAIEGNTIWKKFQLRSWTVKWVGPWTYNENYLLPFQKKGVLVFKPGN